MDAALGELRRHGADESDDRVLGQAVDRVVGDPDEAGERCRHDDRAPLRHDAVEAAHAVYDAVDVDADRPAVLVVRQCRDVVAASDDARVQAGEVDRADVLPGVRVGDVEARDEVELLHFEALAPELRDDRLADTAGGACDQRCHGMSTTFPVD